MTPGFKHIIFDEEIAFLDLQKALDNIDWSLTRKCICTWAIYITEGVQMQNKDKVTKRGKGIQQGCFLSLMFFDIYINTVALRIKEYCKKCAIR